MFCQELCIEYSYSYQYKATPTLSFAIFMPKPG